MVYEKAVINADEYIDKLNKFCKSTPCIQCKFAKVGCWRERVVPAAWTDKRNDAIKYVRVLLTMYEMIKDE